MVNAVLVGQYYDERWASDDTKGFALNYWAENYNDTEIFCNYPLAFHSAIADRVVVLESISLQYTGQIGARVPIEVQPSRAVREVYVGTLITIAAYEDRYFGPLMIPIDPLIAADSTQPMVLLWPSNYLATDDVRVTVTGHIKNYRTDSTPGPSTQPVSLEGYKWPLRRY